MMLEQAREQVGLCTAQIEMWVPYLDFLNRYNASRFDGRDESPFGSGFIQLKGSTAAGGLGARPAH